MDEMAKKSSKEIAIMCSKCILDGNWTLFYLLLVKVYGFETRTLSDWNAQVCIEISLFHRFDRSHLIAIAL